MGGRVGGQKPHASAAADRDLSSLELALDREKTLEEAWDRFHDGLRADREAICEGIEMGIVNVRMIREALEARQTDTLSELCKEEQKWSPMGFEKMPAKMALITNIEQGPGSSGVQGFIRIYVEPSRIKRPDGRYDIVIHELSAAQTAKKEMKG